jgi:hypothetical protein
MDDGDGPIVARTVYQEIFRENPALLDMDVIPYALDEAMRVLRQGGASPSRWAPYVHIGI